MKRQSSVSLIVVIGCLVFMSNLQADTIRTPIRYGIEQDIALHAAYYAYNARFVDWDGDGRIDIVCGKITTVNRYKPGFDMVAAEFIVYFCKNIGSKENPRFLNPVSTKTPGEFYDEIESNNAVLLKIKGRAAMEVTDWNEDGKYDILIGQNKRIKLFLNTSTRKRQQFKEEDFLKFKSGQYITFLSTPRIYAVDWDNDGKKDLIVGTVSREPYRKAGDITHRYDKMGGSVYFCKNVGTNERPEFNSIEVLKVNNEPIQTFGPPRISVVDWDRDGDKDLICTDWGIDILYFENTGTITNPTLAAPVNLKVEDREIIGNDGGWKITIVDLDNDGDKDLILIGSWYEYYKNTGTAANPRLYYRGRLMQAGSKDSILTCDTIITPGVVDWDGDGDHDFIVGNEPGFISFIENIGDDLNRKFLPPVYLKYANGETIQMFAKDTGGSCWGHREDYDDRTSPVVCDWDNDGDLDILTGTMGGHVYYLENIGTRKRPKLAKEVRVQYNGKDLKTLQRTRPGIVDWDGDGVIDLILPDDAGCVRYYKGKIVRGKKILTRGEVLKTFDSQALMPNRTLGNASEGRTQYEIVDWDEDGDWDILIGYLAPGCGTKVMYYKNIGTNVRPLFGGFILIPDPHSGHSPGIDTFDWNKDGVKDIIIGNQEGQIFWCDGTQFKDTKLEAVTIPFSAPSPVIDVVGELKSTTIPKTLSSPVIDGNLNDASWQKAAILKDFVLTTGGEDLASFQTKAYLTYDNSNLYLSIECLGLKSRELVANFKEHDSSIWKDDSVEIFLDINHDRKTYYQFITNSIGTKFELRGSRQGLRDRLWDAEWQVKTNVKDDRWIAEISIPFRELGIPTPKSGDIWGFNLVSNRKAIIPESSQWSYTYGTNHAPRVFGNIVFGKRRK